MDLKITVSMDKKTIECLDRLSVALGNMGSLEIPTLGLTPQAEIVEPKAETVVPKTEEPTSAPTVPEAEEPKNWEPQAEPTPTVAVETRTYAKDELSKAASELVGLGKKDELLSLLRDKYAVQGFNFLDVSRYGEFATDIRVLGAKI